MSNNLLTTKQAAEKLGVSPAYLEKNRLTGGSIPFVKIAARCVRYSPSDLENFIASRRMTSTSQYQNQEPAIQA